MRTKEQWKGIYSCAIRFHHVTPLPLARQMIHWSHTCDYFPCSFKFYQHGMKMKSQARSAPLTRDVFSGYRMEKSKSARWSIRKLLWQQEDFVIKSGFLYPDRSSGFMCYVQIKSDLVPRTHELVLHLDETAAYTCFCEMESVLYKG